VTGFFEPWLLYNITEEGGRKKWQWDPMGSQASVLVSEIVGESIEVALSFSLTCIS